MWEDPIVAELHRTRKKLAAVCSFDIEAYFADVRKRQAALGTRLIHPKKRPNQPSQPTGGAVSASAGSISSDATPTAEV